MIATYKNDVKTAKALIDAGADVNIQDDMKNNPFPIRQVLKFYWTF